MKAILEFDVPASCAECAIVYHIYSDTYSGNMCPKLKCSVENVIRHPNCPLKIRIEEDVPKGKYCHKCKYMYVDRNSGCEKCKKYGEYLCDVEKLERCVEENK